MPNLSAARILLFLSILQRGCRGVGPGSSQNQVDTGPAYIIWPGDIRGAAAFPRQQAQMWNGGFGLRLHWTKDSALQCHGLTAHQRLVCSGNLYTVGGSSLLTQGYSIAGYQLTARSSQRPKTLGNINKRTSSAVLPHEQPWEFPRLITFY